MKKQITIDLNFGKFSHMTTLGNENKEISAEIIQRYNIIRDE